MFGDVVHSQAFLQIFTRRLVIHLEIFSCLETSPWASSSAVASSKDEERLGLCQQQLSAMSTSTKRDCSWAQAFCAYLTAFVGSGHATRATMGLLVDTRPADTLSLIHI